MKAEAKIAVMPNPWNNGAMRAYVCTGPTAEYCPIEVSNNKIGTPIKKIMMRYGITKAPIEELVIKLAKVHIRFKRIS